LRGLFSRDVYIEKAYFEHNLNVLHHSNVYVSKRPLVKKRNKIHYAGDFAKIKNHSSAKNKLPQEVISYINGKQSMGKLLEERGLFSISRRQGFVKFPKGLAVFIPKGSYLTIENHYNPSGVQELNKSIVKLYEFKKNTEPQRVRRFFIMPGNFVIPPNKSNFKIKSFIKINEEISILTFNPHMHYRGVSSKLYIKYPSQNNPILLGSVPFYQMKFERALNFKTPVLAPKGSELIVETIYDNSSYNLANPDSKISVRLGDSTYKNEMHSMRITYVDGVYVDNDSLDY
jgi:hypothetical protein